MKGGAEWRVEWRAEKSTERVQYFSEQVGSVMRLAEEGKYGLFTIRPRTLIADLLLEEIAVQHVIMHSNFSLFSFFFFEADGFTRPGNGPSRWSDGEKIQLFSCLHSFQVPCS